MDGKSGGTGAFGSGTPGNTRAFGGDANGSLNSASGFGTGASGTSGFGGEASGTSGFGARPAPSAPPVKPLTTGLGEPEQPPEAWPSDDSAGMNAATFANPSQTEASPAASNWQGVVANENLANLNGGTNDGSAGNGDPMNGAGVNGMSINGAGDVPNGAGTTPNGGAVRQATMPAGLGRPMTKIAAPEPAAPKKSRRGLIIGLVCGTGALLLVVMGIVTAIQMLNRPDPVAAAVDKLARTGLPTNLIIKGDLNAQSVDQTQLVSHYKMALDVEMMPAMLTNQASATITLGGTEMKDATFQIGEVFSGEDELYVMSDGLDSSLQGYIDAETYLKGKQAKNKAPICEDENGDPVVCEEGTTECQDADGNPINCSEEPGGSETKEETPDDKNTTGNASTSSDGTIGSVAIGRGETAADTDADAGEATPTADPDEMTTGNGSNNTGENDDNDATAEEGTSAVSEALRALVEQIDGKWIKVEKKPGLGLLDTETEKINELLEISGIAKILDLQRLKCDIDLIDKFRNNTSNLAQLYRTMPFISGANAGTELASKQYPTYRIVIDQKNYEAFVQEIKDDGMLDDYLKCSVRTLNDVLTFPSQMPALYVEMDNGNNLTRLYFAVANARATMNVNLDFSYPNTINVQRPQVYQTMDQIRQAAGLISEPEGLKNQDEDDTENPDDAKNPGENPQN